MKITLALDPKDVNHILAVLAKQPFEQVNMLIADIMRQASNQATTGSTGETDTNSGP